MFVLSLLSLESVGNTLHSMDTFAVTPSLSITAAPAKASAPAAHLRSAARQPQLRLAQGTGAAAGGRRAAELCVGLAAGAVGIAVAKRVATKARRWQRMAKLGRRAGGGSDFAAAVADGRMTTVDELTIRKGMAVLFAFLFFWQSYVVYTTGSATIDVFGSSSYSTLAVLATSIFGFGGSGVLSL
eukprot:TRINITY_DN62438_c0_g1_i1.p1 TRINITY_DN62438_c0_g1~~TRINITY_DN62438_c0_g1_i1.p1  ORF type:complete len:185 (+),score=38.75 TRINITY_DN62438_c0_g1_i1:230-784(+)